MTLKMPVQGRNINQGRGTQVGKASFRMKSWTLNLPMDGES